MNSQWSIEVLQPAV